MDIEDKSGSRENCSFRLPAGQDPAKREQILAGASRVINRMGYDAASVNDIAREAGVSKGTIYVYFTGKEELFEALMEETRERIFQRLEAELERPGTTVEKLRSYAMLKTTELCSDRVIQAHRVVLGVAERMPEIGWRFYERGNSRGSRMIITFLEAEVAAGRLVIKDIPLAAAQFFELSMAGLFRRRLFGQMAGPPSETEIAKVVDSAIEMFMCSYGAPDPASR